MGEQSGRNVRIRVGAAAALVAPLALLASPSSATVERPLERDGDGFRCGATSPLQQLLGADYPDLALSSVALERARGEQRTAVTDAVHAGTGPPDRRTSQLLHALATLAEHPVYEGSGYRVQCRPADDGDPQAIVWRFDLQQVERVETLSGDTLITAFEDRYDVVAPAHDRLVDDVMVAEVMSVPQTADWYIDTDGESLRASLRARRRSASSSTDCTPDPARNEDESDRPATCAYLIEIDWRLASTGTGVELAQTFYTNGIASELAVWRLAR